MLALRDLRVGYGGPPVLRGLSCELAPGLAHGIVGRNGEGKTTLLRTVSGLLTPDAGAAIWRGPDGDRAASRFTAFLPSEPFFYPWITAVEHLEACAPVGSDFDARSWCDLLELPADRPAETFSSGMKRRLGLLACIALDRPVLALDEPFNNLDAESSHLVSEILRRWVGRGRMLLITSHVPGSLEQVCDEIHWLHEGIFAERFGRDRFAEIAWRVFGSLHEERLQQFDQLLGGEGSRESKPAAREEGSGVAYIVSVRLDPASTGSTVTAEQFESYMRERHIPEIWATRCFRSIEFERVTAESWRTRYVAADRAQLERYLAERAPGLRADFAAHFPSGFAVEREVVDVAVRW